METNSSTVDLTRFTTFAIPVYFDTDDREQNFITCLKWLDQNFAVRVVVGEISEPGRAAQLIREQCNFKNITVDILDLNGSCVQTVKNKHVIVHKTRAMNLTAVEVRTPTFFAHDVDVLLPKGSVLAAVKSLLKQNPEWGAVFPFNGRFVDAPPKLKPVLLANNEIKRTVDDLLLSTFRSVGLSFCWRTKTFFEDYGCENEAFLSYGPEDMERIRRVEILGIKYGHINDIAVHLHHKRTPNSDRRNPFYKSNIELFNRTIVCSAEEVRREVNSWSWTKQLRDKYRHQQQQNKE